MTFDELFASLPGTGWLTKPEAELLYRCALSSSEAILEVGCYHGRSSVLLASFGRPLYCVDPFLGFSDEDPAGERAKAAFLANTKDCRNLQLFPISVEEFREHRTLVPVGMAYLDGDHTYQGTLNQIDCALAMGAKVIAIHDVNDSGGGVQVKEAALKRLGPWDSRVERLAVWTGSV